MAELKKDEDGNYEYTDYSGDKIVIGAAEDLGPETPLRGLWLEAIPREHSGAESIAIRVELGDLEALIAALRDAATPRCQTCKGTGKRP